jgi:hypothetical protein
MLLRFVQGRPVSQVTEDFLAWACARLSAEGKKALLLVWDNASWHVSQRGRTWIKAHNRQAKRDGGVRIVALLPAGEKSVAQRHRTQVGPRQEGHRRTPTQVDRSRNPRRRLQILRLPFAQAAQTRGRLILT